MVQEARDRFDLHPCACAALGRTLSVGSIMGSMLKSDEEMLTSYDQWTWTYWINYCGCLS